MTSDCILMLSSDVQCFREKVTARRKRGQLKGALEEQNVEKHVLVCPYAEGHQLQHQTVENFASWFGYLLGDPKKTS